MARLQNEVGTKYFFRGFHRNVLGLYFVGPKKIPQNSRQIFRKISLPKIKNDSPTSFCSGAGRKIPQSEKVENAENANAKTRKMPKVRLIGLIVTDSIVTPERDAQNTEPENGVQKEQTSQKDKWLRSAHTGAGKSHPWTNTIVGGNFGRTFRTIGPYEFPQEKLWTNEWSI